MSERRAVEATQAKESRKQCMRDAGGTVRTGVPLERRGLIADVGDETRK